MLTSTRPRLVWCALAFSVILLHLIPAPLARADNDDQGWSLTEVTIPITQEWVNGCSADEERIYLTGLGTAITRTKIQPDGTTDVKTAVSISLAGTGTSGAEYTLEDSSVTNVFGLASLPFSYQTNRIAKLSGDGPDMFLHAVVKVTLNADGTITHDFFDVNVNCTP